jgi:3-phosphoshikimate 1-carboxyvinyltransferase
VIDLTSPLDRLPDPLPIEPLAKPFDVTITPPGSKSITCRAYVLAALARGESRIIRPLRADDTHRLLAALCTLGAEARADGDDVPIKGVGGRFPRGGVVNLGDGGAPTRFMIAAACLAAEPVVVDGSPRMRERPIAEGVDFLRALGATIDYVQSQGRLPVRVTPSDSLEGGSLEVATTASSQFISALLLIGANLRLGLQLDTGDVITSRSYVDLTLGTLRQWEIDCVADQARIEVRPGAAAARAYRIEPDASSAVYWWTAARLIPGARVRVPGIAKTSLQPDALVLREHLRPEERIDERDGGVAVRGLPRARPFRCLAHEMPDAAVALAVTAAMAEGGPAREPTFIGGLRTLRFKETDRIAALANELGRIGCTVQAADDSITIDASSRHDDPVVIETYNDHRMAMAFAVLGLARPGISIRDPACVSKSYPTFWKDFARLYGGKARRHGGTEARRDSRKGLRD